MSAKPDEDFNENTVNEEDNTRFAGFGDFLTNQYELLKRTLWSLPIEDLDRAALVCRSWRKTVTNILKQRELRNKIRWHLQGAAPQSDDRLNCYKNNIMFRSQLVLGFQLTKAKDVKLMEEVSYYEKSSEGQKMIIPGSRGRAFLIKVDNLEVPICRPDNVFGYARRRNAAVFFPYSNRFTIFSTLFVDERSLDATINGEIDTQYGPLQGLLMFANNENLQEAFNNVYNNLCHRFQKLVPLAGGSFPAIKQLESGKWQSLKNILVFGFHGDVDCYSDILSDQKKSEIEPFMKKMRENLGSTDSRTEQRIAIVIRCVSRPYYIYENKLFQKYFPDIPAFVLESYGEYGVQGDSTKIKEAKILARSEVDIRYAYSSMYFIVTIRLPPSTL